MGSVALIVAGLVAAIGVFVFVVEPLWVLPVLEWLTPGILYRVKTRQPLVALSFDDGPHPEFTPRVLEILEEYEAKATFFLIGERVERNSELVRRIAEAGHETGNHYWKDGATLGDSRVTFVKKLERTERVIQNAETAGPTQKLAAIRTNPPGVSAAPDCRDRREISLSTSRPIHRNESERQERRLVPFEMTDKYFRAPGGVAWPWQLRLARERGYTCVLGCAYAHDPMRPPVWYMRWLIEENLRPGTIVILHDGIRDARKSIEVLPQILEYGKQRGLRFVSIGELRDSCSEE